MTSEPEICVCGCTEAQHHSTHEHSHYPESRTVETWQACDAHDCMCFRPVLPWPNEPGWWWCSLRDYGVRAVECRSDESLSARGEGDDNPTPGLLLVLSGLIGSCWNDQVVFEATYGPARFTKLIETSPFQEQV